MLVHISYDHTPPSNLPGDLGFKTLPTSEEDTEVRIPAGTPSKYQARLFLVHSTVVHHIISSKEEPLLQHLKKKLVLGISSDVPSIQQISKSFRLVDVKETNFKITADIRKLFGVELVRFNRSISLPSHNPETHYLLFRQPTGPRYEATTRQQLFLTLGLVRRPAEQVTTWDRMLPSKSQFPKDVIGIHSARDFSSETAKRSAEVGIPKSTTWGGAQSELVPRLLSSHHTSVFNLPSTLGN
uniref:Uncharacterized protein n=1 Tax=Timema cristinae TaxID=61476 RepID=A0A7R9DD17_TIMCR|nr:unnamed protein product [Timema cristinae]